MHAVPSSDGAFPHVNPQLHGLSRYITLRNLGFRVFSMKPMTEARVRSPPAWAG
jgi:hypothetical protein